MKKNRGPGSRFARPGHEKAHVQHPPHPAHRVGRLRSRRHRLLSALFRDVRPLDRAADRAGARDAQAQALRALRLRRLSVGRDRRRASACRPASATRSRSKPPSPRSAAQASACSIGSRSTARWRWKATRPAAGWCATTAGPAACARSRCPTTWSRDSALLRLDAELLGDRGKLRAAAPRSTAANSAAVPGLTSCPVALNRDAIAGSAITSLMSAAIRSRSAAGMLRGPNRPMSPSKVSRGKPACATVGVFGLARRALAVGDRRSA